MARLARVVIPGLAHHVTQRGNGRQRVFTTDADYRLYLGLVTASCKAARVTCLGFCLMPHQLHLILVPAGADGLRAALSRANRAYAGVINARRKAPGHFWRGRYGSAPMDDPHLLEALRHILTSPVKARLAARPEAWPWSSARCYLKGKDDGLTSPRRLLRMTGDMRAFLGEAPDKPRLKRLLAAQSIGRPAAEPAFIRQLEKDTGRTLLPEKRGPKARKKR